MKHSYADGIGRREVWIDGILLDHVVEADDVAVTALANVYPFRVIDGELVQDVWSGCTMVVRSIGNESKTI